MDGLWLILPARRLADNGLKAWEEVRTCGYEGLVGKDAASPYRGGRTLAEAGARVTERRPRWRITCS